MATILEQYRKRQNEIREQIAANSLPLDQMLIMQELNYRICVLETFESLCKSAPVTMDTKAMGFHFQLVDAYVRFTLNERKFGPKTDAEGQKKRETALQSFTQVAQDGRKRFSSFSASTQEQYKTCINNYIKTILPVWILNEKGYPSPGRLRYERGIITNNNKKGSELPWNRHVLKDLLVNVVYIGNLAQGRSSQCLYKGEKYHWTNEADWDVVEGTHEPIISMELWNMVQEINKKVSSDATKSFGRYAHLPKRPNPYGSVLRCADCGRVMKYVRSYTRPRKDGVVTDYYNYKCPTNIELGDTACSKKSIRADDLDKIVLSVIRKQMDLFLDTQKTLLGLIALEKEKAKHSVPANRVKELQDKLDQKKKLFSRLYIDFKDSILTQQEYLLARDVYQKEIAAYESELQELQAIKAKTKVTETGARKWNRLISRYHKAETVTEEMVEAMVDEIRVNTDGSLDIRFKYMPEFEEMFKECERIRKEVA